MIWFSIWFIGLILTASITFYILGKIQEYLDEFSVLFYLGICAFWPVTIWIAAVGIPSILLYEKGRRDSEKKR